MRRDLRTCKSKIAEHQKQILEYATRMDEYDKKNEETSRKFSTLLQELNKCKTELQYWRSKTPVIPPMCNNCGHISFIPTPTEDLQALSNQDVRSDGNCIHFLLLQPLVVILLRHHHPLSFCFFVFYFWFASFVSHVSILHLWPDFGILYEMNLNHSYSLLIIIRKCLTLRSFAHPLIFFSIVTLSLFRKSSTNNFSGPKGASFCSFWIVSSVLSVP